MNEFEFSPTDGLKNKTTYPTVPANEDAARAQFQDPLDQVKDFLNDDLLPNLASEYETKNNITNNRKLSASGDFTGTLNGAPITAAEPGLSSAFNAHLAETVSVKQPPAPLTAAKGNGVDDDTVVIQYCVNYVTARGGGIIYFPAGTYLISSHIKISDDDTMGTDKNNPIKILGETYNGLNGNEYGSSIKRTTSGDILRINVGDDGYGYNKVYHGLGIENINFVGDPGADVIAIKGYWTRMQLKNVNFTKCHSGVNTGDTLGYMLNSPTPTTVDYSDASCFQNVKFIDCFDGVGIKQRGADASVYSGVHIENCTLGTGVYLLSSSGTHISNVLTNGVTDAFKLDYCDGIHINGWHAEGVTNYGLNTIQSTGIEVNGFYIYADNINRFRFTTASKNITIKNGYIRGTGGYDLSIFDTSESVSFSNVKLTNDSGVDRNILLNAVSTAKGYCAASQSSLKGLDFLQLKNGTNYLFYVDANGKVYSSVAPDFPLMRQMEYIHIYYDGAAFQVRDRSGNNRSSDYTPTFITAGGAYQLQIGGTKGNNAHGIIVQPLETSSGGALHYRLYGFNSTRLVIFNDADDPYASRITTPTTDIDFWALFIL